MSFLTTLPRNRYDPRAFAGFDPKRTGYNPGTAKAMAWLCQLAYETADQDKVASIAADWSLTVPPGGIISEPSATILPLSSTQLVVALHSDAVIMTFAGTDPLSLADWITDFDFKRNSAGIASGFALAAQSVAQRISDLLDRPIGDRPIIITGHSLGAALAALTAYDINSHRPGRVMAVYTFGMPRTGGGAFAVSYEQALGRSTYRLVHGDDLVPTVPPSSVGSSHVGRLLRCSRLGQFQPNVLQSAVSDEPEFSEALLAAIKELHHRPLSNIVSFSRRAQLAAALTLGIGPSGMRTDVGGIAIEMLPLPLRDHMPDRYIAAT